MNESGLYRRSWQSRSRQRGSMIIIAIVSLVVVTILALALMDEANSTFQQGHRQPRLTSLESLADGGVQYGYWDYTYGGQTTLPFTSSKVYVGTPGYFVVTVSDNSASIANTLLVVSTAHIYNDQYSVTRVLAKGGGGGGGASAPSAPTNLVATANPGSIGLTWNASSGATSYNIYRGTSANGEGATPYATSTTTSYTDSNATVGTTYYYFVTSVDSSGESSHSNEASADETTAGYVTVTPSTSSPGNTWSNTEVLTITNTQPLSSLTITVVAQKTDGLVYESAWNTMWSGYVSQTYVDNGSTVTYTAVENAGDVQPSGTNNVDDQFTLNGPPGHVTTGDTYVVNATAGGVSQTFSGHF